MGILIKPQNGKNSNYTNALAIPNTIRYITRTRPDEDRLNELLLYGSPNVLIYGKDGIQNAIDEFNTVQRYYHGRWIKGPKVHHEVFRMSSDETDFFVKNYDRRRLLDGYALNCSRLYADLGFQVVYAVHLSSGKGMHIHFICNSVSYKDGLKWHFSIGDQRKRENYFNQLLYGIINSNNVQYICPSTFWQI